MYMEYWIDLDINIWKNGRKIHILSIFGGPVPVPNRHVPVQVVLYFLFDQRSYFGHNLLIYYLI